jgi:nucleotide-binding universal stress UspA family protein
VFGAGAPRGPCEDVRDGSMTVLRQREGTDAPARAAVSGGVAPRPVVLATLSVRVHPDAERMAIESALETAAPLIIANMLWLPPHPTTLVLAREVATLPHEEDLDAVRETAARAADRGLKVELLRISSRRPLAALLELIEERGAGLVVLGPDPRRSPRWWRTVAAWRIRRQAGCLVWIAPG